MRVAISACLAGIACRYNAKDKFSQKVMDRFKEDEVLLFCPEDAVLSTPRKPIDIIEKRLLQDKLDVTEEIENEALKLVKEKPQIVVLKSKSPSCALKSAKSYSSEKIVLSEKETGVFAKVLLQKLPDTKFYEEIDL